MGSLGWVQGLVFGAAPRIENPFSADPLPCVGLGLLPTAVNLAERERTLVAAGKQGSDRVGGGSGDFIPRAWNSSSSCFAPL